MAYSGRMLPRLPDIPVVCRPDHRSGHLRQSFGAMQRLCASPYLKVPPFIATLGMQTIVYGICPAWYTKNRPWAADKDSYTKVANDYLLEGVSGQDHSLSGHHCPNHRSVHVVPLQ